MDKRLIVSSINAQLAKINIASQIYDETDITISCSFYDTKWRTGNKKIDYQAAAFADETQKILFFWESVKIADKMADSGISTSTGGEITYQSGASLYQQVKGIKTTADGAKSEYLVDLGAIKKIFRETTVHYGWKFRVVMNKEKTLPPPQPIERLPQPRQIISTPRVKKFCRYCGNRIEPDFIFCSKCGKKLK